MVGRARRDYDRASMSAPEDQPTDPASSSNGAALPALRASDAERDESVAALRLAAAEGRLTFEELGDRVDSAWRATTRSDLERLTADLPAPAGSRGGGEIVVPTKESRVFGDVRRSGAWKVPASSKWESLFGDIVLDLREAQVTAREVTIDAGTVFGDILLLVPEGVAVEVRSRLVLGDVRQDAGLSAPAGAPRVILTGGSVFGDVKVRARRLSERLVEAGRARLNR